MAEFSLAFAGGFLVADAAAAADELRAAGVRVPLGVLQSAGGDLYEVTSGPY